jgi:hypothetical protein
MDFGIFQEPIKSYQVLFTYHRQGEWSTDFTEITGLNASEKKPASVAIALNLSSLPAYARDTTYLRKMLRTTGENVEFSVSGIELAQNIPGSSLKNKERDLVNNASHVITLGIKNIYKSGSLKLVLPLQYDTSYRQFSTMDDRKVSEISGKTFAFEHLIDGVREAYLHSNQYYFNISIPVKK